MRAYHNNNSFFTFIRTNFGNLALVSLKRWVNTQRSIIKTKSQIFFLKNCLKLNVLPSHLYNNNHKSLNFFNRRSKSVINRLSFRFSMNVLRTEISDSYCSLRFLYHRSFCLMRVICNVIPSTLLDSFFIRQNRYFCFLHHTENRRINDKLTWLIDKRRRSLPHVSPIKYFCTIPPTVNTSDYKSKLRSNYIE